MHNFPIPYQNELVYSTIARAGVRFAITSPKSLLDEVFGDRKVIATMDMPSNLSSISCQLKNTGQYSVNELIYKHTMFPLFSLFIDDAIRLKAIKRMQGNTNGTVHLSLGITASKMKMPQKFQVCTECIAEQLTRGETYWSRDWYLPELPCPKHHSLNILHLAPQDSRHSFQACSNIWETKNKSIDFSLAAISLTKKVRELLELPSQPSPSRDEWSNFYKNIAFDNGLIKGNTHIRYQDIFEQVQQYLLPSLKCVSNSESSWLRNIFRKHRKSFNYLQHLSIWQTFMPEAAVADILTEVKRSNKIIVPAYLPVTKNKSNNTSEKEKTDRRALWQELLTKYSIKNARKKGGGALYAWLYRHDKTWLIAFNAKNKSPCTLQTERVDWHQRDKTYSKQLLSELNKLDFALSGPRRSRSYLIKQLEKPNLISRKIDKLPILKALLERYSESVFEYQSRRLALAAYQLFTEYGFVAEWRLLRAAGLSKERIHHHSKKLLNFIINNMERV